MKIFIANLGYKNAYWPVCLSENVLSLHTSEQLLYHWHSGDRDGWIEWAARNMRMINGQLATKSVASRWYNLVTIFHETESDFWVHRDGARLFWCQSISGPIATSPIENPYGRKQSYVLLKRSVDQWRSTTVGGRPLLWRGIHPKAHDFLQTEATYQEVLNDRSYKEYVYALLNDLPLDSWHELPAWKKNSGAKNLVRTFSTLERTIFDAILRIRETVARADGRVVETTAKIKMLTVPEGELRSFLERLYEEQGGLCMLTGLRMLLNGEEGAPDLRLSVDRIDSNGHYDPRNLQLVCRFANKWKSSSDNARFKELIEIVRER